MKKVNRIKYNYKLVEKVVPVSDTVNDSKCRFLLDVEMKSDESDKHALVILQNPSMATETESDKTINRVLEVMAKSHYKKVSIVNIIPIYGTKSKDVNSKAKNFYDDFYDKVYGKNDEYIKEKISQATKIFVAWGGRNSFDKDFYNIRIGEIRKLLSGKKVYCAGINKNGTPTHPARNHWKKDMCADQFAEYSFLL